MTQWALVGAVISLARPAREATMPIVRDPHPRPEPSDFPPESPHTDRVSAAFQRLVSAAAELNAASDEFAKPVGAIDAALKKLNLGVAAWVPFAGVHDSGTGDYWERSVGYSKVGGRWGISIRSVEGNYDDDPTEYEEWLFSDAPRVLRLDAVEKLPDLLERLTTEAAQTAEKLRKRVDKVNQVAKAISQVAAGHSAVRKVGG
jgi:hypothetical protein